MRVGKYDLRRGDQFNVVLSDVVVSKKNNEEYLSGARYYSTWEQALLRMFDLHIVSDDTESILKEIREAKAEIIKELRKANLK